MILALRAAPQIGLAVRGRRRKAGVRLDIALMGGLGAKAPLDHDIRGGKARVQIAMPEFAVAGDVGRRSFGHALIRRAGADRGGIGRERRLDLGDMGQGGILNPDRARRAPGQRRRSSGHRRDGVAVIEDAVAGEAVFLHVRHRRVGVGREIGRRHHGLHPGHRERGRGIDPEDAGVRVRAAQDRAVQHPRRHRIGAIEGAPCHLLDPVGAGGARADDAEILARGVECHVSSPSSRRPRPERRG